jgi:nucleotide-binding universal stress UspA family protein
VTAARPTPSKGQDSSTSSASVYPTVIVGTDGSATASQAVERTAALAAAISASLLIACAYHRTHPSDLGPPSERARMPGDAWMSVGYRAALDVVQDARQLAVKVASGLDVDVAALEGEAAEQLLELAESRPGSLLAVGSQGMTGSQRFLLGGVPHKVSHHAVGDVLIIRTGQPRSPEAPGRLLVATDGSATAARAVDRALELASALGSALTVLTVSDDADGARRILDEACERGEASGVACDAQSRTGEAAEGILAASDGHDLVVVGNRGMTGAGRFFLGGVPNKVSHHADTDLLIVNTTGEIAS